MRRLPPRRSRSPPVGGNIDRYVPRSPQPRRSRSPSRSRFEYAQHGVPQLPMVGKPGAIDRYVPPHNGTAPPMYFDPHRLDYQVTFNYFSDWYHQENPGGTGPNMKEEVKQKYDEYKDELTARLAKLFVTTHKNDEWFKERYVPGEKEVTKAKIVDYRRGAFERWRAQMQSGALDNIDRETGTGTAPKSEDTGLEPGEEIEEINRTVEDGGLKPVLLIKTISPTVSRAQLEELASTNLSNFHYISLSDPNPLKKFHRIGFILLSHTDPTSEPAPVDESIVELLNGKSIHDDVHGDFVCHVGIHNGPTSARTKKVLNEAMSLPENLKREAKLVEKCIEKLEAELHRDGDDSMVEYDGWEMIKDKVEEWGRGEREKRMGSEEEGEESGESEVELKIIKKTIDMGVEYLRRVFSFCIYCVSSSDSIVELTRKCPGGHMRRPTPASDFAPDNRTVNWTKAWQDKLEFFVSPPQPNDEDYKDRLRKVGGKPVPEAVEDEVQRSMKQEDEGKYRCKVAGCTKLFKAEEFWRKHLDKKHGEWLQLLKTEAQLVNSYVLDPCRVHPPKIEQNNQGGFQTVQTGGNRGFAPMMSLGTFGGPAPPPGTFQPPPGFNFNAPFFAGHHGNGADKYVPNHLMPAAGPGLPDAGRGRDGGNGVGPQRRRENRVPPMGAAGLPIVVGTGRERFAPYSARRDRGDRERERERRDREMRELARQPGNAPANRASGPVGGTPSAAPTSTSSGTSGGGEAELAVLGRSVKSYMDLDAAGGEGKKSVEELDY
ncbi:hypothetical protein HOY82DRAFT_503454 [Tuber indicum]|nr:hypothetical protein HOY82DRAFT_503454 [Tuber indicum]